MKRLIQVQLLVLSFIFLPLISRADSYGQCPFRASDSSAMALASDTKATITDLLSAQNGCSEQFTNAVNSVQGIPELVKNVQDPDSETTGKLEFTNSEIAQQLSDPNADPDVIAGLYTQKQDLERYLRLNRNSRAYADREDAKQHLVIMSENLLSTMSSAMKDPNSQCAQNISRKNGSSILSIGLAALSSAGPLLYSNSAKAAAATQLLSNTVSLFNSLSPKALNSFQNSERTIDMACLYHSIVSLSCSQAEKSEQQKNMELAKSRLEAMGQCIADGSFYNQIRNIKNLSADLTLLARAVATTSPETMGGSSTSGSAFESELTRVFSNGSASSGGSTEKQSAQAYLKKISYFKDKLIDHPDFYDSLSPSQKQTFNAYLESLMLNAANEAQNQGEAPIKIYDSSSSGGMATKLPMPPLFRANVAEIEKLYNAKLNEATGGSNSELLNQNDSLQVHQKVNVSVMLPKVKKYRQVLQEMKTRASGQSANNIDWAQVVNQVDESDHFLGELEKWLQISPDGKTPEEYRQQIYQQGQALRGKLNLNTGSSIEIDEEVNRLVLAPVEKSEMILTQRDQTTAGQSVFDPGFSTAGSAVTDYEKFSSLRDTYDQLTNSTVQLADQSLVTQTRDLFEGRSSLLRKNLVEGIKNMRDQIASSSNPQVAREMVSQLCALAYSLPVDRAGQNPIGECEKMMPARMADYLKSNKDVPNCSYYRYFRDKTREDFSSSGRSTALPMGGPKTKEKH